MSEDKKSGNSKRKNTWTEERVELLRKLWAEGLSASEIARELGDGISRNAVIGKVHRMGLPGRAPARSPNSRRAPAASSQPRRQNTSAPRSTGGNGTSAAARGATGSAAATARKLETPPAPQPVSREAEDVVTPFERGRIRDIMELTRTSCRWPIGDPGDEDFAYCGARAMEGLPYCEHHARIAYQNLDKKRAAG
jgi:GcrA cell cycle regulator